MIHTRYPRYHEGVGESGWGEGGGLRQDGPGHGGEAQVREPRMQEQIPDGADL